MLHKKPDATHRAFFVFRNSTKPDNIMQLEQPTKCDNKKAFQPKRNAFFALFCLQQWWIYDIIITVEIYCCV